MQKVMEILKMRGLVDAVTDPVIETMLNDRTVTLYAGFDPTSDSLQVGNLVTIMVLSHFQRCGHRVLALVGGATGMIGDPSGRSTERNLLTAEQVDANLVGIRENLSRFLDFAHPTVPAGIVNNHDWLGRFTFIEFLRDVGKHFRMGSMLGKESVKTRLAGDAGMSYAEFSYQLLQAYDFLHLYDTHGCTLQIGGSDQWGNITAGIDLIRKLRNADGYGVTMPLICDRSGRKFGKSAGNAVYLDARKTSVYQFYQFFFRQEDADVVRLLWIYTFLSPETIAELERQVHEAPETRAAQRRLADEVTRLVHGESGLALARQASQVLFGESMDGLKAEDLLGIFADVASTELPGETVRQSRVTDLAVAAGVCSSKGEARRLVLNGGLYVSNRRVDTPERILADADIVDGQLVVFRTGKRNFHLVKVAG
ncbi:MAG: tyrosine--tRNA ligase [Lentisphaerae bacterium RIFOXYA12_FULL_60_10]|nr:MAG: tyrosine--tRNA ligase [Lentisphaerae bacterium RIFOXYA12_FULL_60_10]